MGDRFDTLSDFFECQRIEPTRKREARGAMFYADTLDDAIARAEEWVATATRRTKDEGDER